MKLRLLAQEKIFAPGCFPASHASTLIALPGGRFLAAWFAGTKEGSTDVSIHGAMRDAAGKWSAPVLLARALDVPHWNPVLFCPLAGPIVLYFKTGLTCDGWETWHSRSHDEGATWTTPERLVPGDVGGRGPVKNKPITLSDGSWLAGASREAGGKWRVFVDRSVNGGRTWTESREMEIDRGIVTGQGVIQPTLWESAPGRVHMLMRSSCGRICRADSCDFGVTWSPIALTDLPNPNSGIDLAKSPVGTLLLAYNPVAKDWGPRTPLTLAVSIDNAGTWRDVHTLEDGPGEFSYPAVIALDNSTFAGTYTWKRDSVVFWVATLDDSTDSLPA